MKILLPLFLALIPSMNAIADTKADLEKLVTTYTESVRTLDMNVIETIWALTPHTSFVHPRGHQTGWQDIKQAFYLETMGRFVERKLTARNINIRIINETAAWGDFYWDFDATFKDGATIQTAGRETQVWEKIDGTWKIVHVHYSGLPVTGDREGF